MTQRVTLPNGDVAEFPDEMTPEVIASILKHKATNPTIGEDMAKAAAYALPKAAASIAGLPHDIAQLAGTVRGKLESYLPDAWTQSGVANAIRAVGGAAQMTPTGALARFGPGGGDIRGAAERVTGEWYDPQTRAGKATDTAIQAGALMGKNWLTNPAMTSALVGSITGGTEAAGALTGDNPLARAAGGLVGGGLPAVINAARGRAGTVVRDAIGTPTQQQIAQGVATQELGRSVGLPLMGTESLDRGHQLASAVLASPSGNRTIEAFLRGRPEQVKQGVNAQLIAATGQRGTPATNAARAQQAATDVIGKAESARTAAVSPYYKAAEFEQIPPSAMRPVANEIQRQMFASPIGSAAERPLAKWYSQAFPHSPEAPEAVGRVARAGGQSTVLDLQKDDIVTAIRKLGGINPADERIGSLATLNPFPSDPRYGPVWRKPQASGKSGTTAGHSPDRMAEMLYERGYLSDRNNLDELVEKVVDSGMGRGGYFSTFRDPAVDDPLAAAINDLTKQLAVKNAPRQAAPEAPQSVFPETQVGRLNQLYKNLGTEAEIPTIGATAEQKITSYPAQQVRDALGQVLKENNANIASGQRVYQQITRDVIEPLRAGPVGRVATPTGFDPADQANVAKVTASVADATSVRPAEIRTLYSNLNAQDKRAFPGIVQTHLENQLDVALKDLRGGPNPTAGAKFRDAIAGTPIQRENFDEMMRGVAQASGADPKAVVEGANKFLMVLDRTGRTPGVGSQTAGRTEINAEMGKTLLGDTLSTISLTPTKPLARRFDDWIKRARYTEVAKALTAPDSVQLLVKMAKLEPNGLTARYYAAVLLGADDAIAANP